MNDRLHAACYALSRAFDDMAVDGSISYEQSEALDFSLNGCLNDAYCEAVQDRLIEFLTGLERREIISQAEADMMIDGICDWDGSESDEASLLEF